MWKDDLCDFFILHVVLEEFFHEFSAYFSIISFSEEFFESWRCFLCARHEGEANIEIESYSKQESIIPIHRKRVNARTRHIHILAYDFYSRKFFNLQKFVFLLEEILHPSFILGVKLLCIRNIPTFLFAFILCFHIIRPSFLMTFISFLYARYATRYNP